MRTARRRSWRFRLKQLGYELTLSLLYPTDFLLLFSRTMHPLHALLLAVVTCLAVIFRLEQSRRAKYSKLPPGPKPHFIYGNNIENLYPWRFFYRLSKEYGPVLTVWQGRKPLVVISDVASAEFLLQKHAGETADRPPALVASEIFSNAKRILLVGYNERWSRHIITAHQTILTCTQDAFARPFTNPYSPKARNSSDRCRSKLPNQ